MTTALKLDPPDQMPPFRALLDATDEPPEWLANDFLLANEYQLIAGDGGSFKTTVFLSILGAIAGGYDVLDGFPTGQPRRVLLVSGEDSAGVLKNRLLAIAKGHGWDTEVIRQNLWCFALDDVQITSMLWQSHLEHSALALNARIIGLDPLADLIDGDENDNSAARPVIQWFRRLGARKIAVLLCHHYGRATEHKQGAQRIRGASAWMHAARAIYTIEEKDGSRWLGCGKMSRAERPKGRELRIEIQSEPHNRAIWTQATVALAHPPAESWMVRDQRDLTPGERTALKALNAFPDEALSWSRWKDVSGMSGSGLSEVIGRLRDAGYVTGIETGKRGGRTQYAYQIATLGRNALLMSATPRQLRAQLRGVGSSNSATPPPPIGGGVSGDEELPVAAEIAALYAAELENGPPPGLAFPDDWEPGPHPEDLE